MFEVVVGVVVANRGGVCGGFDVGSIGDCGVRGDLSCDNRTCGDCV